ncbi:hypothetical protein [Frischella perrara]|uniref:Lipoprotein n=1 Tax=Frischella perrara TaxID=1267021 RepID=A0A318MQE6_FRIPE|nr:hypothetical protein [Frischella perrara]MCT6875906.1 hypothetical protein [Frischella perrara]PXY94661.1 hypothetical protein DKK76_09395 [Frischella perrara]
MKFWKIVLTAVLAISLFGCAGKYQPPKEFNTPVTGLTKEQVKKSILAAASTQARTFGSWNMQVVNNNTITAKLLNRGYNVVVKITYSEKGYNIKYVSASDNLKGANGKVHRNYNRWVNNLNDKIQQNIHIIER